ncbi:hypothetical protein AAMO2058_001042000 [Amorphochlora amoebiformis]
MARPWRAMAPLVLLATAITILPPSYQAFPPNIPFSNRHLGGGIVAAFQGAATALVVRPVSLIFQPFKILQRTARRHRVMDTKKRMVNAHRKAIQQREMAGPSRTKANVEEDLLVGVTPKKHPIQEKDEVIMGQESFTQQGPEVRIKILLSTLSRVRSRDVDLKIELSGKIIVKVFGQMVLNGTLFTPVELDETTWELETDSQSGLPSIIIGLVKKSPVRFWGSILKDSGDPRLQKWLKLQEISDKVVELGCDNFNRQNNYSRQITPAEFRLLPDELREKYIPDAQFKALNEEMQAHLRILSAEDQMKFFQFYGARPKEVEELKKAHEDQKNTVSLPEVSPGSRVVFTKPPGISDSVFERAKDAFLASSPENQRKVIEKAGIHLDPSKGGTRSGNILVPITSKDSREFSSTNSGNVDFSGHTYAAKPSPSG